MTSRRPVSNPSEQTLIERAEGVELIRSGKFTECWIAPGKTTVFWERPECQPERYLKYVIETPFEIWADRELDGQAVEP